MQNSALQTNVAGFADHSGLQIADALEPTKAETQLCVLLVEDDEADVYLIKSALAKNPRVGEIVIARDGAEALDLLDLWATQPDLAIVDLHMPRKDGFALLRDFAARGDSAFPSVVLTSSRAGADALRARKRGAAAFLTKPNTNSKLTTALNAVIACI